MADPKFIVPVSQDPREMTYVEAEMLFDAPYAYHEHHPEASYEVWYYTIKDLEDGVQKSFTAYVGARKAVEATNYARGSTLSFGRLGEGKKTNWYISHVSGPKRVAASETGTPPQQPVQQQAQPQGQKQPMTQTQNKWEPIGEEDKPVILAMIEDDLNMLEMALALVSGRSVFTEATLDQQIRIARGSLINAMRSHRPGMALKEKLGVPQSKFLAGIAGLAPKNLVDGVLEGILENTGCPDSKTLTTKLIAFGFTSNDIKSDSEETLLRMFNIIHYYFELQEDENVGEDEAMSKTADKFGLELRAAGF